MKTKSVNFFGRILMGVLILLSCAEEKRDNKEIIRPVRYQKVSMSGGGQSRTFSGVSKSALEVKLSFKVGGTIQSVEVKVGDRVKKGALIAEIVKTDFQLRYEQAKVALADAKMQMQSAKSAFERVAALYENNNASLHEYESAKTAYGSAQAAVSSYQRGLQLALSQLNDTKLTAPMEGIVTRVHVENNENVTPGKVVVEINSGSEIEVSIGVPESYISQIKEGDRVEVRFTALTGKTFEGVISEVSYAISSSSSTYPISIVLTKPSSEIRPGMAADVTLDLSTDMEKARIVVPINTVAEDQTGRFVYTVRETGKGLAVVHKKAVRIGELTAEGLEILEGLQDGELIVTAGISKLTDGMTVRILK